MPPGYVLQRSPECATPCKPPGCAGEPALPPLSVLAAGSLRSALTPLLTCYSAATHLRVTVDYGPAGLLRQRIEAGEPCDLFASANVEHPQALLAAHRARSVRPFTRNRLCLTVRLTPQTANARWLDLLGNADLILGTSTPGSDPSGDYAWSLLDAATRLLPPSRAVIMPRGISAWLSVRAKSSTSTIKPPPSQKAAGSKRR